MMRRLGDGGQMTIGLAVALPVALAVTLVAYNALAFFGDCAKFDRIARNAVRICAVSPAYGQGHQECAAAVEAMVTEAMGSAEVACAVTTAFSGLACYEVTLGYKPTLFGIGMKDAVFGVELFELRHSTSLCVDSYDPGILM